MGYRIIQGDSESFSYVLYSLLSCVYPPNSKELSQIHGHTERLVKLSGSQNKTNCVACSVCGAFSSGARTYPGDMN